MNRESDSPPDEPANCVTFPAETKRRLLWASEAWNYVDRSKGTLVDCFSAHAVPNGQTLVATVSVTDTGKGKLRVRASDRGACSVRTCLQRRIAELEFPLPPPGRKPDDRAEFDLSLSYYPLTTTKLDLSGPDGSQPPTDTPCVDDPAGKPPGRLPPAEIQRLVRESYPQLRACYETGLARFPTLSGRVSTRFTIGSDGGVADVWTEENELADCEVVACMRKCFKGLTFPEPEGGGIVTVVYPIMFAPG